MTYTPNTLVPTEFQMAYYGQIGGKTAKVYRVMGSRSQGWTSTTAFGDACEYLDNTQALMNTPTAGQTLYLRSSSASDAAAGTGVRTVRIVYLDAAGVQQVRTDTLTGTTPVSIGTGYSFIQWMESEAIGSTGVAAGTISLSSTNGVPTVATTFDQIAPGGGRSLSGRYKIPTAHSGYMISWAANAINNTMDVRLRADVFADDRTTLANGAYHFQDRLFLGANTNDGASGGWLKYPAGSTIKIAAIPGATATANRLDCDMLIAVVAD
jgi:hypothetical protein